MVIRGEDGGGVVVCLTLRLSTEFYRRIVLLQGGVNIDIMLKKIHPCQKRPETSVDRLTETKKCSKTWLGDKPRNLDRRFRDKPELPRSPDWPSPDFSS